VEKCESSFVVGSLGRGGISEAASLGNLSRSCGTRGLLTLRSLSPDAGRGADAEREGGAGESD